jgi:ABC-2 type transport system permease protein
MSLLMDLVQPFLSLAMFFFLGHFIDGSKLAQKAGLSTNYFAFVVLGMVVSSIVSTGLASFSEKVRTEQTSGTMEALVATPTSPSLVILASATYDFLVSTVNALILLAMAAAVFGFRPVVSLVAVSASLLALIFVITLCATLGILLAGFTLVFKKSGPLVSLIMAAITLLCGIYYPVAVLPSPLRQIANLIPLTWVLTLLRQAALEGTFAPARAALLLAVCAVSVPIAVAVFRASLRRVRSTGTLAHY